MYGLSMFSSAIFLAFGLDVESTENEIQEKRYDIVIIDEYECIIHACK